MENNTKNVSAYNIYHYWSEKLANTSNHAM